MKDWIKYVHDNLSNELWGFILLDYYYTQKEKEGLGEPSRFIDGFIDGLPDQLNNLVTFHHGLLCVCVHLLGNDFEDITKKSYQFIKKYGNKLNEEDYDAIVNHYEVYKKSKVISDWLKKERINKIDDMKENISKERKKEVTEKLALFASPVKLFYSYSHEDEDLRDEIAKNLAQLKREGYIESWHDREILPGAEFENIICEKLKEADVILLLISSDFINSDYCYSKEMDHAITRHNNGDAVVIPIILRHCMWKSTPFGKFLVLPKDGEPIKSKKWDGIDEALTDVAKGMKKVLKSVLDKNRVVR